MVLDCFRWLQVVPSFSNYGLHHRRPSTQISRKPVVLGYIELVLGRFRWFCWFWVVLLVVLGGFGWFWVVLGGFGWFRVLVTTEL